MPYPFGPWPSWAEIINTLSGLGVRFKDEQLKINGSPPVRAQYFEHAMDGKTIRCEVSFDDVNDLVPPSMIRYICNRLRINPKLFGLHLG